MSEILVLAFSFILVTGFFCQWFASYLKVPAILFLLLSGIFVGPVFHWLNPDRQLGALLFPFVSFSVAVILFEGSMTLNFAKIKGLGSVIGNLISIGVIITFVSVALCTHFVTETSWAISFLFASLMTVTGPTVIRPMLRILRPNANISKVLQWEGILIDPIGAILAVLVFEVLTSQGLTYGVFASLLAFLKITFIGLSFGFAGGICLGIAFKKYWIPQHLHNFAVLSVIGIIFSSANYFLSESGLLAVTVMGITLANFKDIELEHILNFKESLSIVLVSFLFIVLSARINFSNFMDLKYQAIILFLLIQFVIRPLNVYISSLGSDLTMNERHLISWVAPRGIIAAAISSLFALQLENLGYADANKLVSFTFFMIIATIILQSVTAKTLAIKLGVAEPKPEGLLIIGSNKLALAIAEQLKENQFYVCLIDESWAAVNEAKMKGLITLWGNPISKYVEEKLDLLKIKQLLIITPYLDFNVLAAKHYRYFFEEKDIFTIPTQAPQKGQNEQKFIYKNSGRTLFSSKITFDELALLISEGAKIKTTALTEQFSYEQYIQQKDIIYPLFAIDPQNSIHVFTDNPDFNPMMNWKIIGISNPMK
ncbi:cation:proton antiporter [Fluoribacter dumoffii]|uniref:cation:proton antiporter n=1 Tax=Fluoribacter dumoffii TaxID=463 RepID=UPI00224339A5|nr:sodium:proton antiporter [Fluoribacter dumoffii]MCW8386481.1 cation:proton antiporter [Fluoribacter dumoffii]MCW8498245.1 cation:proton antiporter [Fluoribacter dumoffii]